jgi:DNA-binding GntR family transcriptional regulator
MARNISPQSAAGASASGRSRVRTSRLAEKAFQRLQEAVITGKLKEGEIVRESRLARQWNLSRTPLREAVRRAAECGYLVLRPNQAPMVRRLTAEDIRHIYSLREILECFALRSAWTHLSCDNIEPLQKLVRQIKRMPDSRETLRLQFSLDRRLHRLWIDASQNPWLISILDRLILYRPNLVNVLKRHLELSTQAFNEHAEILQAIASRDLERAASALCRHIQNSQQTLLVLHQSKG